ncbi:MAG: sugar phosphate nucleotidyltransferase [Spirochaetota bacterium]|mgnify:CR=1 FL=1
MKRAVLIMAGGKGERFWPLGRVNLPKQFLRIGGSETLIGSTISRMLDLVDRENMFIVTGARYRKEFELHMPDFLAANIIYEPEGRDTLPAVAYASAIIKERLGECVIAVLAADHIVGDLSKFHAVMRTAYDQAEHDEHALITIGISPVRPDTNYGYVHVGKAVESSDVKTFSVLAFKEKPDKRTAERFLSVGDYYWNSGMFVWRTDALFSAIEKNAADIHTERTAVSRALAAGDAAAAEAAFLRMRKVSVDFGIMEGAKRVLCVTGSFGWDDVGSFSAYERIYPRDEKGNTLVGKSVAVNAANSIVINNSDTLAVIAGVEDIVVVRTEDALLVCRKGDDAAVKDALKKLRDASGYERFL